VTESKAAAPFRVFVIDDDIAFGDLTVRRLQRLGYSVKMHPGSSGAMSELLASVFDLVILDVNMPGLSGPEVMGMIRSSRKPIKVMFYSSMDVSELRKLADTHGADGYVGKGASSNELEVRLRSLLGTRSIRTESGENV
jgi:two-component system OmpR family response regulator